MSENMTELEALYIPWHNHQMTFCQLSKAVYYLGYFTGFGEIWARHKLWQWNKASTPMASRGQRIFRSQDFQERALDATLGRLKDCVVFSTTATYYSQFQNACLLKERGFKLLMDCCYRHPGYGKDSDYRPEHPGIPDRYWHWEHIWWKVIGQPREIGLCEDQNQMNNCGVDSRNGLDEIKAHDNDSSRRNYLTVAWLPRGTPFPKLWKRFYSAEDYKLGVNFPLISEVFGSKVQKCPHNFDLKIFEGWAPDFEKWSPA